MKDGRGPYVSSGHTRRKLYADPQDGIPILLLDRSPAGMKMTVSALVYDADRRFTPH